MANRKNDLKTFIGFDPATLSAAKPSPDLVEYINLKLAALGCPIFGNKDDYPLLKMGSSLLSHYQAKDRYFEDLRPPVDQRIEQFLHSYLAELPEAKQIRLPGKAFNLSQHGLARMISLPPDKDDASNEILTSYRVKQGVLHNPKSDRRTTQGVFHVTEGGLPIPDDKKAVPKVAFARLFLAAMKPPSDMLCLPFTSSQKDHAKLFVSLLLRPVVCPAIPGVLDEQSMEVRFFVPGSLVCNLDFVESIFGNGGDPYLPENDAALDLKHWTGHTGCVILAPHLTQLTKKELGLPHISEATERQRRDRMCWSSPDELYNDGGAFKITARTEEGVIVTLIADNYFGYCKKEVKTQLSYAANLFGLAEEEHAGGALAFPSYDLGEDFYLREVVRKDNQTLEDVKRLYGHQIQWQSEGYGIDAHYPQVIYTPENARFSLIEQKITWTNEQGDQSLKLMAGKTYIQPSGYKVSLRKPAEGRRWRLIGTRATPTLCHKPCTVSGGGKSEISKSIADAIIHAPFYVSDLKQDFDLVEQVLNREYGQRFKDSEKNRPQGRSILSPERSLGSVIKLLTPSDDYNDEHNAFITSLPSNIKELVLIVKRFYKPDWGHSWRDRFSVDIINGVPGHELKYRNTKVIASYLRVGYDDDGSWRVFSLRKDFSPAAKIQTEDDISAAVTVPREWVERNVATETNKPSVKFIHNCEYRLFQRPDDAIIRGYDKKTEWDMARDGNFFSNYQPLSRAEAVEIMEDVIRFDYFTDPIKDLIRSFVQHPELYPEYLVLPSNPRIVDGKPSKNPRYLQTRLDLESPVDKYVAEMGVRLHRRIAANEPVVYPVNAVLPGRRNNPPEPGVRPLSVHNPIHYMQLPELFMEFISSMTGKSPSTTGAGSEGALTKAPFNALLPVTDLNNALMSYIVTGYKPYMTAAGYVGPKFRVDHDISLLVPEIWCRMRSYEREPEWLIERGLLEKVPDMQYEGRTLPSSILGYRINQEFVNFFMGRVFANPSALFTEEMLKPELQDMAVFAECIDNMMVTHQRVASNYFNDTGIDRAIPPLKALLHIMAHGNYEGMTLNSPEFRALFDRETAINSKWYKERLFALQQADIGRWQKRLAYLEAQPSRDAEHQANRRFVLEKLDQCKSLDYLQSLIGTIGRDTKLS